MLSVYSVYTVKIGYEYTAYGAILCAFAAVYTFFSVDTREIVHDVNSVMLTALFAFFTSDTAV